MNQAPLETEEDLQLVKEYVLLPILADVLERDIKAMGTVRLKMDVIYVKCLREAQNQIFADLVKLRSRMRYRGVKVYAERRTSSAIEVDYLCRGYHRQLSLLWGLVKAELQRRLSRYLHVDLRSGSL